MQLKIRSLKYLIKQSAIALVLLLGLQSLSAQEVIKDKAEITPKEKQKSDGAKKIDGVAAVIGDYIVLDSDIDKNLLQLKASGASVEDITRCQLFGKLLEDKLYSHHAIQDSISISDLEIRSYVDQQIQRFLTQTNGDMDKLLEFYNQDDEKSFRDEMFEINKSQRLASEMQKKIVDDVEITPEEVREFFNNIDKDERPTFGTELKVFQIVAEPKVSEEEEKRIIAQLNQYKKEVLSGSSFSAKAVFYSEDPGSSSKGGLYTLNRKQPRMVKEFREAAFSLEEGQMSEPIKTLYGYHLLYLEKIRGQEYDVRHILLTPKSSSSSLEEAQNRLNEVREKIEAGEITFEDAAKEMSDEEESKKLGGMLRNPVTQDFSFELTKMDPELYSQIQELKEGEVSKVLTEQDRQGKSKYKLMMVKDRTDEHVADFSKDYLKIKELALNEKRFKVIDKWQQEKIMDTYIKITDTYKDCVFNSNWLKK
jgi:peptidyl-prolyl cis-trans isomerase SurA